MFITNVHVFASKFNVQICLNHIRRYVVIQLQLQHCTSHRNKLLYIYTHARKLQQCGGFSISKSKQKIIENGTGPPPLPTTTYFLFGNRLILTQRKVTFLTNWPLDFLKERVQNYRENSRKDPIPVSKAKLTRLRLTF